MQEFSGAAAPLPERLNFARHLLALNINRPESIAYIDDYGELSYGEFSSRVRRFASALVALGLMREQRVLLLLHDRSEWPVAFLATIYAGLIPVPVNTLLTADDYAYLLDHSGAAAAVVSAELLPTFLDARVRASYHALGPVIVVAAENGLSRAQSILGFNDVLSTGDEHYKGADTHRDSVTFWLYSSGSTGRPKGVVHTHANLYWTAELYQTSAGNERNRSCFLGSEALFCLRPGKCPYFSADRRRIGHFDGGTTDPCLCVGPTA
jgi:benzoate-CoA ligase